MKNYFYKLNQKYIDPFIKNIWQHYKIYDKKTDINLMRSIFREVNELFKKIGGRTSSKKDVPRLGGYPDSDRVNRLITNIDDDLGKLYKAQSLVEDDLKNLMNYNAIQRSMLIDNFLRVQHKVYSAYIKNKKDTDGEESIPSIHPFSSADSLGQGSENVWIDADRTTLSLTPTPNIIKPIDTDNVSVFFTGHKPEEPIYPNANILNPASYWKIPDLESHFVDIANPSINRSYRKMMIDDPTNPTGVGICEFESVQTLLTTGSLLAVRFIISQNFNADPSHIYIDTKNSLREEFTKFYSRMQPYHLNQLNNIIVLKMIIPFTLAAVITNEICIDVAANGEAFIPHIDWGLSKVFSNSQGSDVAYPIIEPPKETTDGTIRCMLPEYIIPSRLELVLNYPTNAWSPIDFHMSHWVYSDQNTFKLPGENPVSFVLYKTFDIFVDSEPNLEKEKQRAYKVITKK